MTLPHIDPDNPMNYYYLNQAEMHALRNPHDMNAQLLFQHWKTTLLQIETSRRALAAAVPGSPLTGAPVPTAPPGAQAPVQPTAAAAVPASPGFGIGQNSGPNTGPVH